MERSLVTSFHTGAGLIHYFCTMKTYSDLFFDLDRTLWDFDRNSNETFREIHQKYDLLKKGVTDFNEFMDRYHKINLELWEQYRKGSIEKEVLNVRRFTLTLGSFGISEDGLCRNIANDYIQISPTKRHLFPGTREILQYLAERYKLHIITNGFEEVQHRKLESSGLRQYFTCVITSEDAGCKKPDINIFRYAFRVTGADAKHSLMIGDDPEVDILGAKEAGMDQVLVDYHRILPDSVSTYYVNSMADLLLIL